MREVNVLSRRRFVTSAVSAAARRRCRFDQPQTLKRQRRKEAT